MGDSEEEGEEKVYLRIRSSATPEAVERGMGLEVSLLE